jgi:hypothetical protein
LLLKTFWVRSKFTANVLHVKRIFHHIRVSTERLDLSVFLQRHEIFPLKIANVLSESGGQSCVVQFSMAVASRTLPSGLGCRRL